MRLILAFILALTVPGQAWAWGKTGHRITGAIAEDYLSDEARARIRAILGVEDLAEASNWPDWMRSDPSEFWQRTANPWHYVTVPEGKTYEDVGPPRQGDAFTALNRFSLTILDPDASVEDKQRALRFAVHIIGDLHQPLHVGNGEDRGGNDVKVTFFGEETNLHRLWDENMLDRQLLSYTEYSEWLRRKITTDQAREWLTPDPLVWIGESAAIRDTIYPDGDELSYGYVFTSLPIAERRLAQAGVRMAAYFNALFASR